MTVFDIFLIVLMGAATILCIGLVFFLNKITKSVTRIQKDFSGLALQINPIIRMVTELTEKINVVTEGLKEPIQDAVDIIGEVKERIDLIFNMEEKIRHGITANLSGVASGVKTFWSAYKSNGSSGKLKRFLTRM